ncbi:hypothetical protein NIES4071_99290 [Calothrix sp. NIES-4071]|nr:hypothetical protein NIES4071_99290 [Calothrix sp. NIES-4071]BAZ64192.1 hypothetical protein NIES4105_99220 [Calothrix sp. NIES-4105]
MTELLVIVAMYLLLLFLLLYISLTSQKLFCLLCQAIINDGKESLQLSDGLIGQ